MANFDIEAAKADGYSDEEIQEYLKSRNIQNGQEKSIPGKILSGVEFAADITGAPTRAAISAGIEGKSPLKAFGRQFGQGPRQAPTGEEIAGKLGAGGETSQNIARAMPGNLLAQILASKKASGLGVDILADPLTWGGGALLKGGKLLSKATKLAEVPADIVKAGKNLFARTAAGVTGVEKEALEKASTSAGREVLQQAAGREAEIGRSLIDRIDNAEDFMQEREVVEAAVKEMPAMDIRKVIRSLEQSKIQKPGLTWEKKANAKIQEEIESLKEFAENFGWGDKRSSMISAADFYEKRKALDFAIPWDAPEGDRFARAVNNAFMNARDIMKNELIDGAEYIGKPEYAQAMKAWSEKIQKLTHAEKVLGLTGKNPEKKAELLLKRLTGKTDAEKQALKDLGEIFGEDFLEEGQLTSLARSLGPEGKAGLLPNQGGTRGTIIPVLAGTAGAVSGGIPGAALAVPASMVASPLLATRTIGAAGAVEKGLRTAGQAATSKPGILAATAGRAGYSPALKFAEDEEARKKRLQFTLGLGRGGGR